MSLTVEDQQVDTDTAIRLRDVSVTYDMDRGRSKVVDEATLDIKHNEIIGIVGESGSGKSMIASSLINAAPPPGQTTGEITYHPKDGSEPIDVLSLDNKELRSFRWETVSMVFQGAMSSFNPTMTVRGHFEETIKAHHQDLVEGMAYARELLESLYLDPDYVLDSYPHELSGGMKQRTLIALSLVLNPEVLVMDEPTASLDLLMQRSIVNLIAELQEQYNLTILFITHDLPLVSGLVDRLAVMYAFEFIEIGKRDEVLRNPRHPYTRALLAAVPNMDTPVTEMKPIEGSAPDPVNVPSGCSYHPRCPLADTQCEQSDPDQQTISDTHTAACFHWEKADEEISYATDDGGTDVIEGFDWETSEQGVQTSSDREPVVTLDDVQVHFEKDQGVLEKLFGNDDPPVVKAVDDISLEIGDNDVVALVGESGCGKTTLGKTAIGLQRPTDGTVRYHDQDIWAAKDGIGNSEIPYRRIRQALQIIHQDPGESLNPNRTVQANLMAPVKKYRPDIGPEGRQNLVHSLLERVNMEPASDYATRFPHQLSGGEQQRIALGRALLMQPDLILADESVSALDVSLRVAMMDLMLDLQEQFDTSYLFISHDFANARYVTTKTDGRIGVMYLGNLVEIGPAEEVLQNPKHPYTKALVWSTAPLNPDEAEDAIDEEPPIREIDIPTPEDAPSGCQFHTRCEEIIPPEGLDVDQAMYNEIIDLRLDIENQEFETDLIWERADIRPETAETPDSDAIETFVTTARTQYFSDEPSEPHRERIDEALGYLAHDEKTSAEDLLREHYQSICERKEPNLRSDHPVACHLYDS